MFRIRDKHGQKTKPTNGVTHQIASVLLASLSLIAVLGKEPNEPSFHFFLAKFFEKSRLPGQAAEEYDEARFLMTAPAKR